MNLNRTCERDDEKSPSGSCKSETELSGFLLALHYRLWGIERCKLRIVRIQTRSASRHCRQRPRVTSVIKKWKWQLRIYEICVTGHPLENCCSSKRILRHRQLKLLRCDEHRQMQDGRYRNWISNSRGDIFIHGNEWTADDNRCLNCTSCINCHLAMNKYELSFRR